MTQSLSGAGSRGGSRRDNEGIVRPGTQIENRYRIDRFLAQGGVAQLYTAFHRITEREVVIKLPSRAKSNDLVVRERLLREGQALARARQPGVVDILDAGEHDGCPYLVLERLEGRTLAGLLAARGRFQPRDAASLGYRLARILAHCHRVGIVHRDIKPDNVFIGRGIDEQVKLLDFGIARFAGEADTHLHKLTQEESILGTPEYMAPECLSMAPSIDHRADIYGLGVLLYELLTGAVPHEGGFGEVLIKVSTASPRPLSSEIPEGLRAAVARCLEKEPGGRFASMSEVADALVPHIREAHAPVAISNTVNLPVAPLETKATLADTPKSRRTSATPQRQEGQDARRHPRAPYTTPALVTAGPVVIDGRVEEISEGGLQVIANHAIAPGDTAELRFTLPLDGGVCNVRAASRWTRGGRANRHATGFEFVDLPGEARALIGRYVHLMRGS